MVALVVAVSPSLLLLPPPLLLLLPPLLLLPLLLLQTVTAHMLMTEGDREQCQDGDRGHGTLTTITRTLSVLSGQGALLHPGNGGDFGRWGMYDMCERGSYAHAFQLRVEEPQGIFGDDTALNSVRLYCQSAATQAARGSVTSAEQCWGVWREARACEAGTFLRGVRLWAEEPQGVLDDVGATDVDMVCGDGRVLNGGGVCWGDHSDWLACPQGYAICGIRTRVEKLAGLMGDNTAVNDLMMVCCELP
ncbi:vitelline membrane outer layer protein 1 homolog [Scylla paramamosain]|uniref:vitelline membrane outer layer protein 1 homolog n=1 Tax=Scylla paramamosain TaxID=85552 RepID=UPI0030834C1C